MKFKVDENLPMECAFLLRDAGFEADSVGEESLSGSDDSELLAKCRTENRILLTLDLDFADIQTYPPQAHVGIVVLRVNSQDKTALLSVLGRLIPTFRQRSPLKQLWIVEPHRVRFREG